MNLSKDFETISQEEINAFLKNNEQWNPLAKADKDTREPIEYVKMSASKPEVAIIRRGAPGKRVQWIFYKQNGELVANRVEATRKPGSALGSFTGSIKISQIDGTRRTTYVYKQSRLTKLYYIKPKTQPATSSRNNRATSKTYQFYLIDYIKNEGCAGFKLYDDSFRYESLDDADNQGGSCGGGDGGFGNSDDGPTNIGQVVVKGKKRSKGSGSDSNSSSTGSGSTGGGGFGGFGGSGGDGSGGGGPGANKGNKKGGDNDDINQLSEVVVVGVRKNNEINHGEITLQDVWDVLFKNPNVILRDDQGNKINHLFENDKPKEKDEPCKGDPVPNPEIAPQTTSGIRGGMYGYTRRDKYGNPRKHAGVDLKNPYGAPIYAMYGGTATLHTQYDKNGKVNGAGHYVTITSKIDNKTVQILFFHMQKAKRVSGTVNAGDIIGYQGDSGNLKVAIKKNQTVSHVHIKLKVNGRTVDPLPYLKTKIDPKTGKVTKSCKK